jgi:hypothetical protein
VTGEQFSHRHSLPIAVATAVKTMFDADFLLNCVHGEMQDPESFNNVIWNST